VGWGLNNVRQASPPAGLQEVIQASAGLYHSAAVLEDGTVYAWGDGAGGDTNVPVTLTNAVAVACGGGFTLALTEMRTVVAWGGSAWVPDGLTNVVKVSAHHAVCIAVNADGTTAIWGVAGFPQPAPDGITNVLDAAPGQYHTLALLGTGSPEVVRLPPSRTTYAGHNVMFDVSVIGQPPFSFRWRKNGNDLAFATNRWLRLRDVNSNDGGSYSVIVSNAFGAVESGITSLSVTQSLPIITDGPRDAQSRVGGQADFSVGISGSFPVPSFQWVKDGLALTGAITSHLSLTNVGFSDAAHYAVVVANAVGAVTSRWAKLSIPNVINWGAFTEVPAGLTNADSISGGYACSLACLEDGTIFGWGDNSSGQQNLPSLSSRCVEVGSGWWHCLARDDMGNVYAWGSNSSGQGQVPPGLFGIKSIACGEMHNLALRADGTVIAWGQNLFGQTSVPAGLSNVIAIAAAANHSLALRVDGTVVAWGDNGSGQSQVPTSLTGVVDIAAGGFHSLAIREGGQLFGWGYNMYGQTTIAGAESNIIAIAGSDFHTLALQSDGTLLSSDPLQPPPPSGIAAVACGRFHYSGLIGRGSPRMIRQPMSANVAPGTTAIFLGKVIGAMPIRYQWLQNGTEVVGATNPWIMLHNAGSKHTGNYQLRAVNANGTALSDTARLDLTGGPVIICQPTNVSLLGGQTLQLTVEAGGASPLVFQWLRNGLALTSQTNAVLEIPAVRRSDSGTYSLAISNALGGGLSAAITVTVRVPARITQFSVAPDGTTGFQFRDSDGNALESSYTNLFQVQVSSNLVDWTSAGQPPQWNGGSLLFAEPPSGPQQRRFFRVAEPQ
jgi:alpha-tubulin suppressor-like RCC1 family protein